MDAEDRTNRAPCGGQEHAQRTMEATGHFIASMSHELRTPIHGILSFAEFGLREAETAARNDLYQYFQHIHESGNVLLVLFNDLLDFTKLVAGRMMFNQIPLDLGMLTSNLTDEFEPRFRERGITLIHDEPSFETVVNGDELRLTQMLRHLMSNALRFARTRVSLSTEPGTDGAVAIVLRDDRLPIPADELETLMDPLAAAGRTGNQPASAELGLPIARGIVAAHGGTISIESGDQGTSFHVRFNLRESTGSIGGEDAKAA